MQTQKIGKRYALQRGHRQYKETLQKKYRQQNSPIFKQIHNLLPEHFQNLQQESRCLGCIQELEKAESLNLSQAQRSSTLMIDHIAMRGGQNSSFNSKYSELIEQSLCALLNNSRGYLLVGVSPNKGTVCGVQISDREKSSFVQNVRKVLSKFIMPKEELEPLLRDYEEFDKVFQIRFIPVVERQSSNDETDLSHLYVIRIRVETTQIIRQDKVFYINVPKLGSDNTEQVSIFYIGHGKVERVENQQISEFIGKKKRMYLKKSIENNCLITFAHKCSGPAHPKTMASLNYNKPKKDKINSFCSKKYNYESLVLVNSNEQKTWRCFLNKLEEKKIKFAFQEIKISEKSFSNRKIYYLSHEKNYEKTNQALAELSCSINSILILNVRKNFVILNFRPEDMHIYNPALLIFDKFKQQFGTDFMYGWKRIYYPKLKQEVFELYFQFETKAHAIFAFAILEENNVKVNFVNQVKAEGTLWGTCQNYKQIHKVNFLNQVKAGGT